MASQIYKACSSLLRIASQQPAILGIFVLVLSNIRGVLSNLIRQKELLNQNHKITQALDSLLTSVTLITSEILDWAQDFSQDRRSEMDLLQWSSGVIRDRNYQILDELWVGGLPNDQSGSQDVGTTAQIARVREWLQPFDRTVRSILTNLWAAKVSFTEFTCEWFSRPFLDFLRSNDRALLVEGPSGCGKSMLYAWIVDCLQTSVDGQEYVLLNYSVDSLLPSQDMVCLLKGLLQQTFEQHPGMTSLYNALVELVRTADRSDNYDEVIEALWSALELALSSIPRPTILLIDGLTEIEGEVYTTIGCLQRILDGILTNPNLRLLVLSRPFDQSQEIQLRHFTIQRFNVQEDIRRVLSETTTINSLEGRPEVIDWVMSKANGNYLWPLLILQVWKFEFGQSTSTVAKSLPTSLDSAIFWLLAKADLDDPVTKQLLLFSLVAFRPLRVDEAGILLNIDTVSKSLTREDFDVPRTVKERCASILVVDGDIIRFRHPVFKRPLSDFVEKKMKKSLADSHYEMTKRLLLYLKLALITRNEPTLKPVATLTLDEAQRSQQLLTYALCYWSLHYDRSRSDQNNLSFRPSNDLLPLFPESNFVAALEATYWKGQPSYEAIHILQNLRQARREILGIHPATMQTIAFMAVQYKSMQNFSAAACDFATAFELARQLLPEYHDFAGNCALQCLESARSLSDGTSADISVSIPDMMQYLIAKYNKQLGVGSDRVLDLYQLLARHYADNKQFGLSIQAKRDMYNLALDRFGKSSFQAKAIAGDLAALIEQSNESEDVNQYDDVLYDNVVDTFAVTDSRRVHASVKRAETCKLANNVLDAELEYLSLMSDIAENSQLQQNSSSVQSLGKIGLQYAKFLSDQDRVAESQSILLEVWNSFKGHQNQIAFAPDILTQIAQQSRISGLPELALTILDNFVEWTKVQGLEYDFADAQNMTSSIMTEMKISAPGSVLPQSTEDAFMQMFESSRSQGMQGLDDSFLSLSQSLVESFVIEKRWRDVIHVASGVLEVFWPTLLDNEGEISLPQNFNSELGTMAIELAQAYEMSDSEETGADIYWNVLRCIKGSNEANSSFLVATTQGALDIFEKTGQTMRLIETTQDLVEHHRSTLGDDDATTIDSAYALASLCMEQGETEIATVHYEKIASSLSRSGFYDQQALPALQALLVIYRTKKLWDLVSQVYRSLWETFLKKGSEYRIQASNAKALFKDYSKLLETQFDADADAIHQLRAEYHRGCVDAYGDEVPVTLESKILLAKSWEQQQSDSLEAIHLYESIIDSPRPDAKLPDNDVDDIDDMIEQVETVLRYYYRTHIDTDTDQEVLNKAISLQRKQYQKDEAYFGQCSPKSLSSLAIWVSFLAKEGSDDSRDVAVAQLHRSVDRVLLSDCEGKALYDAAIILATTFADAGFSDLGLSIAHALRERLIFRETNENESEVAANISTNPRTKVTFLTAFETRLRGRQEDFAKNHSRSLYEMTLWDSFQALKDKQAPCEQLMTRGAKLQALLRSHYSSYGGHSLQQQLSEIFLGEYGPAFSTSAQATQRFITVLLSAMNTGPSRMDLPHLACVAVNEEAQRLIDQRDFSGLLEMSIPGFEFMRYIGAYGSDVDLEYGIQLGLILGDQGPGMSSDQALNKQMLELSKLVFQEILQTCRTNDFDLDSVGIEELSRVAAVLGKQENYSDLEVHSQRTIEKFLSADMIVVAS